MKWNKSFTLKKHHHKTSKLNQKLERSSFRSIGLHMLMNRWERKELVGSMLINFLEKQCRINIFFWKKLLIKIRKSKRYDYKCFDFIQNLFGFVNYFVMCLMFCLKFEFKEWPCKIIIYWIFFSCHNFLKIWVI
jgi:hypothetical protein